MPLTDFSLVESDRYLLGDGQHRRRFLDFAFDSLPVYRTVLAAGVDNITPIWLDGGEQCHRAIRRLLGEERPDASGGRVSVYVCAECADLGCGAITVVMERDEGRVSWRDWGYQNNYEDGLATIDGLRDVTFDATQYNSVLLEALDRLPRN